MRVLLCTAVAALAAARFASAQVVVFQEDFEAGDPDEFLPALTYSQEGLGGIYGPIALQGFGASDAGDTATLTAPTTGGGLYELVFDLLIIGSWNGDAGAGVAQDRFRLDINGERVIDTTYDFRPSSEAYVEPDSEGVLTGLGGLTFLRYDAQSVLFETDVDLSSIVFSADTTAGDEGFALDNVRLVLIPATPSAVALGLAGAFLARPRRAHPAFPVSPPRRLRRPDGMRRSPLSCDGRQALVARGVDSGRWTHRPPACDSPLPHPARGPTRASA